jgi:hypothetical protein
VAPFSIVEDNMGLVILAVLLGILARTVIPFLQVLKDAPKTKFDRAFLVPAIVTLLIALLTSPLVFVALPQDQLNNPNPTFASLALLFVAAWGTTDVIRQGQKLFESKAVR